MHLARLLGEFPRPWTLELGPGLTIIHDRSDGGGSTVRSALNDLVLPGRPAQGGDVTGVDGTLMVSGREVPLGELLARVPDLVPVRMPRASALHPPSEPDREPLEPEVEAAEGEVEAAEAGRQRARREWEAARTRWAGDVRDRWEQRVVAARSMGAARARLDLNAPVAGPSWDGRVRPDPASDASLRQLARERVEAARAACSAAEAVHAESLASLAAAGTGTVTEHRPGAGPAAPVTPEPVTPEPVPDEPVTPEPGGPAVEQLASALDAVLAAPGVDAVEAAQVAVEWERIRGPAGDQPEDQDDWSARLRAAQERVARARRELHDASLGGGFDSSDVELLEAAHAEVLAAWKAGEGGSGVRGRIRLEEARAAEQAALSSMGLASYAEFMTASVAEPSAPLASVETARRRLTAAEEDLADIESRRPVSPDSPRTSLSATLAALHSRAAELLGEDPGEDVAGALRERIATDPLPDLLMAMAALGVILDRPATREQAVNRARRWLAQHGSSALGGPEPGAARVTSSSASVGGNGDGSNPDPARRVERDHAAVIRARAELADAEAARTAILSRPRIPVTNGAVSGSPDAGRLELDARAARVTYESVRVVPELSPEVDEFDHDRGEAEARDVLARVGLASLERARAWRASDAPEPDGAPLDEVVWRFLAVLGAGVDDFPVTGAGPAPVILREPFGSLSPEDAVRLCEALIGPSLAVQILVITARTEVVAWAERAQLDAVRVVSSIWSSDVGEDSIRRERAPATVPTIDPNNHQEVL